MIQYLNVWSAMLSSAIKKSCYDTKETLGTLYYDLLGNHTIFNHDYNRLVINVKQMY